MEWPIPAIHIQLMVSCLRSAHNIYRNPVGGSR